MTEINSQNFSKQKQSNSLIAGLRATNEMMMRNEQIEEKKDQLAEIDNEGKETEKNRKKAQTVLSRSDSTGSGRKFLAPTLSDPQTRSSKDRYNDGKKKSVRQSQNKTQHLPHLTETSYHHTLHHHHGHILEQQSMANHHVTLAFEVHDWWSEQIIFQESSDEES
jgi:sodium leak channel non-selective protein